MLDPYISHQLAVSRSSCSFSIHARLLKLASALAPYTRLEARDISHTWTHTHTARVSLRPNLKRPTPNPTATLPQTNLRPLCISSGLHCSSNTAQRAPPNVSCALGPVHSCSSATASMRTNTNAVPQAMANVQRAHAHTPPHLYAAAHVCTRPRTRLARTH